MSFNVLIMAYVILCSCWSKQNLDIQWTENTERKVHTAVASSWCLSFNC